MSKEPTLCSIGVMAYNEERNIGNLLRALCAQQLDSVSIGEIVVVASGCTDNTEGVVEEEIRCDPRIRLLVQERREGKMSAINLFLENARYGVVVIINADVLPEVDCPNSPMPNAMKTCTRLCACVPLGG